MDRFSLVADMNAILPRGHRHVLVVHIASFLLLLCDVRLTGTIDLHVHLFCKKSTKYLRRESSTSGRI